EGVRRAVCRAGRDHAHQRKGGGAGALLRVGGARGRGVGGALPDRAAAQEAGARAAAGGVGDGDGRRPRVALRRVPRGRGRPGRDHHPAPAAAVGRARRPAAPPLGGGAAPPVAPRGRGGAAGGDACRVGRAQRARGVRVEQADHGRLPRGRVAEPGGARAGPRRRGGRARGGAPPDGRVGPDRGLLRPPLRRRHARRGCQPAVPVLPGLRAGGGAGGPGRGGRVAGGVEVGRHPRADDPPPRQRLPVVARRGADHRALPRAGARRRPPARRHGAGRRDPALGRWASAPVRAAPAADRAQGAGAQDPGRGPRGAPCLRPLGDRRRGRARGAPPLAPRAPGGADRLPPQRRHRPPPPLPHRPRGRLGRGDGGVPRRARSGRGRADAEAARVALPHRPAPRRLVEVEGGALHPGRGDGVCAARPRPPRVALHGLHLRRVEGGRAGPLRQGLQRPHRRRDPPRGRLGAPQLAAEVRARAHGEAGAGVRAGLRGDPALAAAQERGCRALPPHPALAHGQEAGGRRLAGDDSGAAGRGLTQRHRGTEM
ncbi:MAG: DNA_ligase_IV_Ku-like, partial [uncultured Gemmatimonadetes bacterium]